MALGTRTVLLTGLSGLLAGALSMAAGEFISVSSQRELLAASKPDEAAKAAVAELDVQRQRARPGLPGTGDVGRGGRAPRGDGVCGAGLPAPGSDNPRPHGAEGGRQRQPARRRPASRSSASGAVIPVLPFLFGVEGVAAVVTAAVLTGMALMLTGAAVAVLSGGPPLRRALRQLAIDAAAAGATYLLGTAFDAATG